MACWYLSSSYSNSDDKRVAIFKLVDMAKIEKPALAES
jgi:hypothetical protein